MSDVFKPMLAARKLPPKLRYPMLVSPKLDGIRCLIRGGQPISRELKPFPNINLRHLFAGLPDGLDGELIVGDPWAADVFSRTQSVVMSKDKPVDGVTFHVFDTFDRGHRRYEDRLMDLHRGAVRWQERAPVKIVEQIQCSFPEELDALEQGYVSRGYEGAMIRCPLAPYKHGLSTEREGYLLKVKRFDDLEATVVGFRELEANENAATVDALGHTKRSSHKDGKRGRDTLGALMVEHTTEAGDVIAFKVGTGMDDLLRTAIWQDRAAWLGTQVKVKHQGWGSDGAPRFPVFLGRREVGA